MGTKKKYDMLHVNLRKFEFPNQHNSKFSFVIDLLLGVIFIPLVFFFFCISLFLILIRLDNLILIKKKENKF